MKALVCKEKHVFRDSNPPYVPGEKPHQGARWEEVSPGVWAWTLEVSESFPLEDWGYEYPVLYIRSDEGAWEEDQQ